MAENKMKAPGSTGGAKPSQSSRGSVNDKVTVQDWQVCIGANGLIESCTVTTNEPSDSITSIGLLAYSSDGQTQYCSQFTAGISGNSVSPSVTTEGFQVKVGATVLGTVFGYLEGKEFFFEQELTVVSCGP